MEKIFTLEMDDLPVRFTPDGRVSIIDAIGATMQSNRAHTIWEALKSDHPEVLAYCEDYSFPEKDLVTVVDGMGWEVIMTLLFCYLSDDDWVGSKYYTSIG
jgi:hypothetical protein